MADRKRYKQLDDFGGIARARAKAGLSKDAVTAREEQQAARVGGAAAPAAPGNLENDRVFVEDRHRIHDPISTDGLVLGQRGMASPPVDTGLADHMGVPRSRAIPGSTNARYPVSPQERQRVAFSKALATDIPGYDVGDQARAYAAAGAPPIDPEFAKKVAEQDPTTMAFLALVEENARRQLAGG